jgi:hypothetical protein
MASNPIAPQFGDASTAPADAIVPVTKADAALPGGTCRSLLVGTAGTANIVDGAGVTRTNVPLQQGYNPIVCQQVRTGGTAADIWALY